MQEDCFPRLKTLFSIAGSDTNGSVTIENSVIAMKGTVNYAGVQDISPGSTVQTQIISDFGLTYTTSGTTSWTNRGSDRYRRHLGPVCVFHEYFRK